MKKEKNIIMPPQNQNYFILLNDEGRRALVVSKAELQPLRRSPFQLKIHLISCMQGSVCPCWFLHKNILHLNLDDFENKCFFALGFMMLLRSFSNVKTGSVSPAMVVTPLSSMLCSHAVLSRVGYNYWNVSRSGCIRILSRSLDQESTNGSPCLVK